MNYLKFLIASSLAVLTACTTTQDAYSPKVQVNQNKAVTNFSSPQISQSSSPDVTNLATSEAKVYSSSHSCLDIDFSLLLVEQSVKDIEDSAASCLQNANVRYEFAQALFQKGFVEESLAQLQQIPSSKNIQNKGSNLVLLETSDLVKRMDSPFIYAAEIANRKLEKWLTRPSEVPQFDLKPPVRKNPPTPPIVVRSEFETTNDFNIRKRTIEKEFLNQVNQLELEYQKAIEDYNSKVEQYNAALEWEIKSRKERAELMRNQFLITEINEALGTMLIDNLDYNADEQIYYADLVSAQSNYTAPIAIEIPLEIARDFKNDYKAIFPVLEFQITAGSVRIENINIPYGNRVYRANLTNRDFNFAPSREVISLRTMQDLKAQTIAPDEKLLRNQININQVINENRRFFQNAIN